MRSIPDPVFCFAGALQGLVTADTPTDIEASWQDANLGDVGWEALHYAWQRDDPDWEVALCAADSYLQLLQGMPRFHIPRGAVKYPDMRTVILLTGLTLSVASWSAQDPHPMLRRWVGTLNLQPLHFDFFGDTMLLLNDTRALSFYI